MPTIGIKREILFKALGKRYTEEEFNDLCFDFGLELDEVTTEKQMITKEQGSASSTGASEEVIYRIDIPANRHDLLCMEGLVRSLLIFQKKIDVPRYSTVKPKILQQLIGLPNTVQVRPYVVAAILRNVNFTQEIYDSFIDLQDKLHQNLCRKRSLASIGTHDLDTICGPFYYDAKPPSDIKFVPLNHDKELTAVEMMEMYSGNSHLKPYLPIIQDKPVYPVIYDKNGTVLSLPPIINGNHSKISLKTKNIFIEITALDLHKASVALDTLVAMFSTYCKDQYTVEAVEISNPDTSRVIYPDLKCRNETVTVDYINKNLGINLSGKEIAELLTRMTLKSEVLNEKEISVTVGPTRHDILHACDIVEDVGISYGYNNIKMEFPKTATVAVQQPLNKLTDQLRFESARCGYTEALTFSLCSREDIADKMRLKESLLQAVHIANPKTLEFQVARTSLLPGLLKTLNANKKMPLPIKLFEISDVVVQDKDKDVGAGNKRYFCAVNYNKSPGFEIIHGLLDRVMQVLEVPFSKEKGYYIRSCNDERFLSGRCAEVVLKGNVIGVMGVLHPEVINNFELSQPCSALEINLETL